MFCDPLKYQTHLVLLCHQPKCVGLGSDKHLNRHRIHLVRQLIKMHLSMANLTRGSKWALIVTTRRIDTISDWQLCM